jgi:hypothetical protein
MLKRSVANLFAIRGISVFLIDQPNYGVVLKDSEQLVWYCFRGSAELPGIKLSTDWYVDAPDADAIELDHLSVAIDAVITDSKSVPDDLTNEEI